MKRSLGWPATVGLFLLAGLLAAGRTTRAADEEGPPPAALGTPAPDFRLNDQEGRAVRLSEHAKGAWAIVAFFPKASTPGCTKEVCSLRDAGEDLEALGVRTLVVSTDEVARQKRFAEEQGLAYPVLSDPDGSAAARYGVLIPEAGVARRVTWVVDPQGVIRHVDREVNVLAHGADLAGVIRRLQQDAANR